MAVVCMVLECIVPVSMVRTHGYGLDSPSSEGYKKVCSSRDGCGVDGTGLCGSS